MTEYYYLNAQCVPQGPHTLDELAGMMAGGRVNPTTLVACKGAAGWEPLGSVLSRENIATPDIVYTPGKVGNCPTCRRELSNDMQEVQLPARCPGCSRALRTEKGGIRANFRLALCNYARFSGRATRAEYWSFQLINFVVAMVLYLCMLVAPLVWMMSRSAEMMAALREDPTQEKVREAIFSALDSGDVFIGSIMMAAACGLILWFIAMFIPNLSLTVRRLHDVGWSGWWLALYAFISFVLPFFTLTQGLSASGSGISTIIGNLIWMADYGLAIFLFVLMLVDSKRGANKYGPSAKYPLG